MVFALTKSASLFGLSSVRIDAKLVSRVIVDLSPCRHDDD